MAHSSRPLLSVALTMMAFAVAAAPAGPATTDARQRPAPLCTGKVDPSTWRSSAGSSKTSGTAVGSSRTQGWAPCTTWVPNYKPADGIQVININGDMNDVLVYNASGATPTCGRGTSNGNTTSYTTSTYGSSTTTYGTSSSSYYSSYGTYSRSGSPYARTTYGGSNSNVRTTADRFRPSRAPLDAQASTKQAPMAGLQK